MIGTGGVLIVLRVAAVAIRGHGVEPAQRTILVAGLAIERGVCSKQREAIVVLLDLLQRYSPSFYRVALFAIRSELSAMNIGVTVGATLSDVREHRLHVTLRAGHILVHATQWITGLAMVEFRDIANRLPSAIGVAVLTRNVQRTVRAASLHRRLRPQVPDEYGD